LHGILLNLILKKFAVEEKGGLLITMFSRGGFKIYCAGPLFNPKEREEMSAIAASLEEKGYSVFLPHRDGLEFAAVLPALLRQEISLLDASRILNRAIFALDVFEVIDSQGLLLNMNGRVPDEGAMVEAGIAWSHGKPVVIFRTDTRSLVEGSCNPLVMGLSEFEYTDNYDNIPFLFDLKFESYCHTSTGLCVSHFDIERDRGKAIRDCLTSEKNLTKLSDLLIKLFREGISCRTENPKGKCSSVSMRP
jgi:nucleoside 2-deoxyribosyltransferase